jgi:hypothetical protein
MILLAERKGERIIIKMVCGECGGLLREDFDGAHSACLTCDHCGYVLEASQAIEFVKTAQSEVCMLLKTLREAELKRLRPEGILFDTNTDDIEIRGDHIHDERRKIKQ